MITLNTSAQLDSLAKNLVDTIKNKLIVDDIPKKTFKDKFMYPHRWYVKQLLKRKKTNFDTTYILSLKNKLTITIPVAKKFYGFNFIDLATKKALKFSPNNYYQVGFNIGNVILNFGFYPGIKFGAKPDRGKTSSKDIQLTLIGRHFITDINYQKYRGFYLNNSNDYELTAPDAGNGFVRPDINVFSFSINSTYIFNSKRYSLRGAFSYTDIQRKSVGSLMAGVYHSFVLFTSFDSTLITPFLQSDFTPELYNINRVSLITIGLSGGYGYTYVYKKIIVSSAVNIGFGGQKTNYSNLDRSSHTLSTNPTINLNAKAAIRYDNHRFFAGIMSTYNNNYTLNPRLFNIANYTSKVLLFSGYRFNTERSSKKILRKLGLIDYNK